MFEKLKSHRAAAADLLITDLFQQDPDRARAFRAQAESMVFDYSKTLIDAEVRDMLIALCDDTSLAERRDAMFKGAPINETEGRAVLHTALRNLGDTSIIVDGEDVMPEVRATREAMGRFCDAVRSGSIAGTGGAFTDVVNIGIGGSDLGPAMVTQALGPYHDGPRCHFVSNVDGAHLADTLAGLDPQRTLVIVASKTFTTIETMTNARSARDWMEQGGGAPDLQFAAVSTAKDKTAAFGIPETQVFGFADWVGGRYSVWGPIGLPVMLAIGPDGFETFLQGAQAMDLHFQNASWAENLPVMLALQGIWHHQICGYPTRAVLPYDQRLAQLPAYLQQLEMESNGKGVSMAGETLDQAAGPVVWGAPGTNGQHAFYQLIHQGRQIIPCEFLVAAQGHEPSMDHHHRLLMANCLAQSQALMLGRDLDEARSKIEGKFEGVELERQAHHRVFEGNRPSTTLIYPKLTPYTLGQIIAAYEHRVFVEGVIMGINSFDQWGVELGKELATALGPMVDGTESAESLDGSTRALLAYIHAERSS